ncbi:recombinase family protein [Christensenella hongkongensis]|uniref:Phage DNA invertase n=1 Tax=Christensenella hongkongensis TaxID=270498 RepID=A0A0M2NI75_9FIRM|nr:recombinase family protein [Christensenella hongkongensis]KKI49970.1 Phage DNA invertase [Christensenella hongkongensis]TCW27914.1 DNA invertase Pin-like site-specific DNA recombinase [Christensenella hongkongensis]
MKKRVWCLYRVSTKKQTDTKNDIPRQKRKCHSFIDGKPDWILTNELYEKGVSGYKKTSENRDVIQQIKKAAISCDFDVLLVYMFDRLGRRDYDTPQIVEWFIEHNIEVWSVEEGQQKIESHADRLITHIRFWQAEGESIKLSQRVSNAHEQMARDGLFRGGKASYGFKLVYSGVIDKKGRALKKRIIDKEEAPVLEYMYDLAADYGYGRNIIAHLLNEKGIPSRNGGKWIPSTVAYILQNPANMGYPAYGKTTQKKGTTKINKEADWILPEKKLEDLAIILEEKWYRAQEKRTARKEGIACHETLHMISPGPLLFVGMIYCGHCGASLTTFYNYKYNELKSIKYVYPKYRCTSHVGKTRPCDGQMVYSGKNIDETVLRQVYVYLSSFLKCEAFGKNNHGETKKEKLIRQVKEIQEKIQESEEEYNALLQEVAKSLIGKSGFTTNVLSDLVNEKKDKIEELKEEETAILSQIKRVRERVTDSRTIKEIIDTWETGFLKIETDRKKSILRHLINRIDVYRDKVKIDFNTTIEEFMTEIEIYMDETTELKMEKSAL